MLNVRFLFFILMMFSGFVAHADQSIEEKYRAAASRKAGDEVLLMAGDSTSIVQSVTQEGNRYTIEFASEFSFLPVILTTVVDSVMKGASIQESYFLEVLSCDDNSIVYNSHTAGYQQGDSLDIETCGVREYPKACYKIAITFYDANGAVEEEKKEAAVVSSFDISDPYSWFLIVGAGLLVLSAFAYFQRKKQQAIADHIIPIGGYIFDQRNMHLTFNGETVELTSKEADLLFLLHSSKNETVERDTILRIVWGDEGDYVGRTLDVFISKLRKKLADDPAIKITNIRGVGYRLVVDVPVGS